MTDEFLTIKNQSKGLFKDRGSKFIAIAIPVSSEEEIKEKINMIKKEYHDARHHCYAYRLGTGNDNWRVNDDGEPSGTAGNPILGQLRSYNLTNTLIIVIRYFGGTLLGTGGLINAYRSAAKDSIENSSIIKETVKCQYFLEFPYSAMNDVMQIIKEENLDRSEQDFKLSCSLKIHFRASIKDRIESKFRAIEDLRITEIG